MLYSGIIWGAFCLISTYRTSLLKDIGTQEQLIAIISAIVGIASGIGANGQLYFHKKYRNKSFSIILIIYGICWNYKHFFCLYGSYNNTCKYNYKIIARNSPEFCVLDIWGILQLKRYCLKFLR